MERRRHYIFPDAASLAGAFACEFTTFLRESAELERLVHVALSGGSTPLAIFEQLVRDTRPEQWSHIHLYWGDERCVPPEDKDSNYGNALKTLIKPLGLDTSRVHRIRGEAEPVAEAERYSSELLECLPVENGVPVFDWIWLGLGEDGHTASIFPHEIEFWNAEENCVVATHPISGQQRISLSGNVINAARRVAFLVSGKRKSRVVNEIVMKEGNYLEYPAFYVRPDSGNLEWYLDIEATSWL